MRWRLAIWLFLSVLISAALWRLGRDTLDSHAAASPAALTMGSAPVPATPSQSANQPINDSSRGPAASLRLSNTTRPTSEWVRCETAILLQNALIDTSLPTELPIPEPLRAALEPGAYIVQARGGLDETFRAVLANAGAAFIAYIPNNACLIRAPSSSALALATHSRVRAVLPYHPWFKFEPDLLKQAMEAGGGTPHPEAEKNLELRLLLFAEDRQAAALALREAGAKVVGEDRSPFGPVVNVRVPASQLAALARLTGVQSIELVRRRMPASDLSRSRIGVSSDPVAVGNYLGLTGTNVLINLNDTGVDASHPDLMGRVYADVPASAHDPNGHGTHVAGVIAGSGASSQSVTQAPGSPFPVAERHFRGVAPAARLFAVGVPAAEPSALTDSYLQETAARTNAFISNNSWHYDQSTAYDLAAAGYDAAVRDALPFDTGEQPVLFVFAAGNQGAGNDDGTGGEPGTTPSPATAKNVITVGALEQTRRITNAVCGTRQPWLPVTDSSNQVAAFSSRGNVGLGVEGDFGRFKPDLVAPGAFVVAARSTEWDSAAYYDPTNFPACTNHVEVLSNLNESIGPHYRYESGTSQAAGAVAGTLALIQEFFEQRLGRTNSPALMKALLINGARLPEQSPACALNNVTNRCGWGVVQLPHSLPSSWTNGLGPPGPMLFFDQRPDQALSTGSARTRFLSVAEAARTLPLRATLVWTDPPANPVAGLKLVNNLDLIITNLETGEVFVGNCFHETNGFSKPFPGNAETVGDAINNVENIFVEPPLGGNYSVTVRGRSVNVNAVAANAGPAAQDYALVISCGKGQVPDALDLADSASRHENEPRVMFLTNNLPLAAGWVGTHLSGERIGAHPPLASNYVANPATSNQTITLGAASQWRFYVFTNDTAFTNLAFATFAPPTLSVPRPGLPSGDLSNHFRVEADIDLYVSQDSALTNLDVAAISGASKSLGRGGSESLVFTNALPGAYYIGVKCETQQGAEYEFLAVAGEEPFCESVNDAGLRLRAFPVPNEIPAAGAYSPGLTRLLAIAEEPFTVRRVVVTNILSHEALGDLLGALTHGSRSVVLNNHSTNGPVVSQPFVFDDSLEGGLPWARPSDGPGSLADFAGGEGRGQWLFSMLSTNRPGTNEALFLLLSKQPPLDDAVDFVLAGGACRDDFLSVPAGAVSLEVMAQVISNSGPVTLEVGELDEVPGAVHRLTLLPPETNGVLRVFGQSNPPLREGVYRIRSCNSGSEPIILSIACKITPGGTPQEQTWVRSAQSLPILDAAAVRSAMVVTNEGCLAALEVGVRLNHPRLSDLVLHLVSPAGTRLLLMENRGGDSTNGLGADVTLTNIVPVSSAGGPEAYTNTLDVGQVAGVLHIDYEFYSLPDSLRVYYESNLVFDSGLMSGSGETNVTFGPGVSTQVTIVVNEGDNYDPDTAWYYTVTSTRPGYRFLRFTEDLAAALGPIKFAAPPLDRLPGGPRDSPEPIYYLPEEPMLRLRGEPAAGTWQLEIEDTRAGADLPAAMLLSWELGLSLPPAVPPPIPLAHDEPMTNTVGPGRSVSYALWVPAWAGAVTNALLSASGPVNLLFNQLAPPSGTNVGDIALLTGVTAGQFLLATNSNPGLLPGSLYYLGVQNPGTTSVSFVLQASFQVTALTNHLSLSGMLGPGAEPAYFSFDVASNATAVSFQLLDLEADLDLVLQRGTPFPTPEACAVGSFFPGSHSEQILLFPGGSPVSLAPGRWYLGIFNRDLSASSYTVLVDEYQNDWPEIIPLWSGVPLYRTGLAPGQAEYFQFRVSTNAQRLQFEIQGATSDMSLVARRGLPLPTLDDYSLLSVNPGTNDELITIFSDSAPVRLSPGDWFLSAINTSGFTADYSILATEFATAARRGLITGAGISGGSFCLNWESVPGVHYFVQGLIGFEDSAWATLSPTLTATSETSSWCQPLSSPYRYFRVQEGLVLGEGTTVPWIRQISTSDDGTLIKWTGSTNCAFEVQWAPLPGADGWTSFTNRVESSNGLFEFLDDGSQCGGFGESRFYRLRQLP
jgi:subtilisin family serine protease/subtilisin-like proprotein convertase family protein